MEELARREKNGRDCGNRNSESASHHARTLPHFTRSPFCENKSLPYQACERRIDRLDLLNLDTAMPRFYLPPEKCREPTLVLTDQEAHHALHVVRVRRDERVTVVDGVGHEFVCEAKELARDKVC